MAVQQNKKSPSRRGMRRAHQAVAAPTLATDRVNGTRHFRHHVADDGYYRGEEVYVPKKNRKNKDGDDS